MKSFLHIGCGSKSKHQTTQAFATDEWREIRFDIDKSARPDILGTMTDMSGVESGSVDAIYSAHNLEHLYPHEVPMALKEFRRVLRPDGFLVLTCPDLQSVCALVATGNLTGTAYHSPVGPIAPLDILYGYRPDMARGNLFMAHRCGFTSQVLTENVSAAGFTRTANFKRGYPFFDLWIAAVIDQRGEEEMRALATGHFPLTQLTAPTEAPRADANKQA
jgi:SAM-dependent methyltransferase